MQGIITDIELDIFKKSLPNKPYCSNNLSLSGLQIRPLKTALTYTHIQPNHPLYQGYLVVDVDHCFMDALDDHHALRPNLVVANKTNPRAHFFYRLEKPVIKTEAARLKPLRYAAAIEKSLTTKLKGDQNYSGLIAKNPISDQYRTFSFRQDPWDLHELHENLDLSIKAKPQTHEISLLGRNCHVFDVVRHQAYKIVEFHRNTTSQEDFFNAVLDLAVESNQFTNPLGYSELLAISKSISKWTWTKYQPNRKKANRGAYKSFLTFCNTTQEKQVVSAHITNKNRKKSTEKLIREAIYSIKADGQKVTQKRIAEVSGVSTRTIRKHKDLIKSLK